MHLDSIQSWGDDRGGGASHAGGHARAARPAPQRGRRAGVRRRWGDGAVQLRRGRRWSAQPRRGDAARYGLHRAPGRPGAGDHRGVRVDAAGPDPPRGLGRADAPAWATERAAGRGSESGPFLAGGGADGRSERGASGRARHDGGPGAGWGRSAGLGGGAEQTLLTEPVRTEPGLTGPGLTEPGLTEPGLTEPVRTEPGLPEPGLTEPGLTEPGRTGPVRTEPVLTEPVLTEPVLTEPVLTEPVGPPVGPFTGSFTGSARVATGAGRCRYAGAMLLYPYLDSVGAEGIFATLTGGPARRYDDLAVLTTT